VQTDDGGVDWPSLTARDIFLRAAPREGETVVFGHSMFATPFLAPGKIGINSGAGRGGLLTALELPKLIFHHA
jgi:serine/threonine protein phosphatase 1